MGQYIDGWFYEDHELGPNGKPKVRKYPGMVTETTEAPGAGQPRDGYITKVIEPAVDTAGGVTIQAKGDDVGQEAPAHEGTTPGVRPAPAPGQQGAGTGPVGRPGR